LEQVRGEVRFGAYRENLVLGAKHLQGAYQRLVAREDEQAAHIGRQILRQ
jgi:hypothetical protein